MSGIDNPSSLLFRGQGNRTIDGSCTSSHRRAQLQSQLQLLALDMKLLIHYETELSDW